MKKKFFFIVSENKILADEKTPQKTNKNKNKNSPQQPLQKIKWSVPYLHVSVKLDTDGVPSK